MAIDIKTGEITNKQVALPSLLIARFVHNMVHGEQAYIVKDQFGTDVNAVKRKRDILWLNGNAQIYTEQDLQATDTEGGVADLENPEWYMDFVRVIRIHKKPKGRSKPIKGHIIDATHFNYDLDTVVRDKTEPIDWADDYANLKPLPVIGFVGNEGYWSQTEAILRDTFKIKDLAISALVGIRRECEQAI